MKRRGRVLVVAGSDSGGGAGIEADIKTVTALGGYAATAITAVTVQDTTGIYGIHPVPPEITAAQMRAVLADIGADAIKIGMLGSRRMVEVVCDVLEGDALGIPVIVDPVLTATSGTELLAPEAVTVLRDRLMPWASLITPNVPELEALTGLLIEDSDGLLAAAKRLRAMKATAVLAKGGHLPGRDITDILLVESGEDGVFTTPRRPTRHTHGTGCTLASAIATGMAQGMSLIAAVTRARRYLDQAISGAPGFGRGHGPLDHGHPLHH
ncbi:MAG: bifunctional hydroxymethylpyrimidine kinase/phosphomethylpyrimidine kinase [Rhodothalassiaceae bacterium]